MHLETTTMYGWCHHNTPNGLIPLCTCSYMAYILHRTFTAPQGADCSGRQTESWDPRCTFPLCSLTSNSPSTLSPANRPHPPLGRRTISAPLQAEVERRHRCGGSMWSALQLCRTKYSIHELCVWVLLKYCSTYIMKSTLLSSAALPRGVSVFLAVWCGITSNNGSCICFWWAISAPVAIIIYILSCERAVMPNI